MITVPVTATYVGLNALIYLFLSARVVGARRQTKIAFGDGSNAFLQQAIRVHSNNFEYVPLALLLLLVMEIMGVWTVTLNVLGVALTLGRISHAIGLSRSTESSVFRFVGTLLTWLVILFGAVRCLLLGFGL